MIRLSSDPWTSVGLLNDEFSYPQFRTRASCLSFDILKDRLGARSGYPVTAYLVAGTQAQQGKKNSLIVLKASNLNPPKPTEGTLF